MPQALVQSESLQNTGHRWQPGVTPKGAIPWAKGQSGNPSGKGGNFLKAQSIYRESSPEAAQTMVDLLKDPDPRVRGFAADKVMERAWGKPRDYDPKSEDPETQPIDPSQFTAKQRALVRQVLQMLLAAEPLVTIEETSTDG